MKNDNFLVLYGISQNPDTSDYILVQNNFSWASGNEEIDNFIQKIHNDHSDLAFEWIPYNQFYEIEETGKNRFMTVYSAKWKDGPLYKKNSWYEEYTRDSNKKVALKCLHSSQNIIEILVNKVKKYSIGHKIIEIHGISQHPDTDDYILVQNSLISQINWISGNEKIDDLIQNMLWTDDPDIVFEWIPYSQFNEIKKIGKGGFATIYSAIWKDGPTLCSKSQDSKYKRDSNKKVALKCLDNSQNYINELLNEIKAYSTKASHYNSRILKVYGVSQDPNTKSYIIVLHYAEGGSFNNWININENYKYFDWENKIRTLYYIANGLKEIHKRQMVHRDFHTGNILFNAPFIEEYDNKTFISDMGLCGKVGNINQNNIYGVMPYVAPEVLRGKPYTQEADIYSFGMVMYFVATDKQPFDDRAHDKLLVIDICDEIRPKINELETPTSYINLMKRCWSPNPKDRPTIIKLCELLWSVMTKSSEIGKAENYRKLNLSTLKGDKQGNTHPQAIYTSRLLNPFTDELSKCLDCSI
ncbi:kinase-like protein [Rhizophagus irregularis]|nr:kinase-like protein [Rhizophagus irregularis]